MVPRNKGWTHCSRLNNFKWFWCPIPDAIKNPQTPYLYFRMVKITPRMIALQRRPAEMVNDKASRTINFSCLRESGLLKSIDVEVLQLEIARHGQSKPTPTVWQVWLPVQMPSDCLSALIIPLHAQCTMLVVDDDRTDWRLFRLPRSYIRKRPLANGERNIYQTTAE